MALSVKNAVKTSIISSTTSNITARYIDAKTLGIENVRTLFHVVSFFGGSSRYGEPGIVSP